MPTDRKIKHIERKAQRPIRLHMRAFTLGRPFARALDSTSTMCERGVSRVRVPADEGCNKPTCVIAHTTKGKGVSFMEDTVLWHYRTARGEELAAALSELENAA